MFSSKTLHYFFCLVAIFSIVRLFFRLNEAAWFVFPARVGVILCLLPSTPSFSPDSLDEQAEVGAPRSLLPCVMGLEAALTPPQEGAGQRQPSTAAALRDLFPPNPVPSAPSRCPQPGSRCPALPNPYGHSPCPPCPTKGSTWWPPACTWLELFAVLSGGSG